MGMESVRETLENLHILTLLSCPENSLQVKYDSACIVWVTSLISHITERTRIVGEREEGAEEIIGPMSEEITQ
jgi:hypothetical protein